MCCGSYHTILRYRWYIFFYIIFIASGTVYSLTRWSSVQFVPDADLLGGGTLIVGAQGYYYQDISDGDRIFPLGFINFGIIEWVNLEAGYTGGLSVGLKARILGETRPWMPSLAIGARNIFSHREAYLFDRAPDSIGNDFYMVLGKTIEAIRLRFHAGVQSIPDNDEEVISPFAALEKYFGMGVYMSIEAFVREKTFHPSLFVSWRFWKKKCELSAGAIDIMGMFVDRDDVPSNSAFYESSSARFVRPGVWLGFRFNNTFKIGKTSGFSGIESSLNDHSSSIQSLRSEVDSLKLLLQRSTGSIEVLNKEFMKMTDSTLTDEQRYRTLAVDKLALLSNLYSAEPFEPDAVNNVMAELIANRDYMLPALYEIVVDPVREIRIRALAITALGEIGTSAAADVVVGILGQSTVPELTIECLIALGKMKETRAVYLMQQLANDPNDDVAFTAAEVLQKLEKETGISTVPIPQTKSAPISIPEKSIGGEDRPPVIKQISVVDTLHQPISVSEEPSIDIESIEKPDFDESTVAQEPDSTVGNTVTPGSSDDSISQPIPPALMLPVNIPSNERTAPPPIKESVPDTEAEHVPTASIDSNKVVNLTPTQTDTIKTTTNKADKKQSKKKQRIDTSDDSW